MKIRLENLHASPYQPEGRATPKNTLELQESMAAIGQLEKVKVYEDDGRLMIAAGHRRCMAAKCLGWVYIECDKIDKKDAPRVFADTNTGKPLKTKDAQRNFVAYPETLTPGQRASLERARRDLGEDLFFQILIDDRNTVVTVRSEAISARKSIGYVNPTFAGMYSISEFAKAVYEYGVTAASNIRQSVDLDLNGKGKQYMAKLRKILERNRKQANRRLHVA